MPIAYHAPSTRKNKYRAKPTRYSEMPTAKRYRKTAEPFPHEYCLIFDNSGISLSCPVQFSFPAQEALTATAASALPQEKSRASPAWLETPKALLAISGGCALFGIGHVFLGHAATAVSFMLMAAVGVMATIALKSSQKAASLKAQ